jgi:hypothetical protein
MNIPDKLKKIRAFFADDGLVAVLEEVTHPAVAMVEGDRIPGQDSP